MTPPVKYNPVEANRPGFPITQQLKTSRLSNFKNIFNKNIKDILGGFTSFNAAPYAMLGVMTTQDTLPDDYHVEIIDGKPTVVEHNLGTTEVKVGDIMKNSSNKFQWDNKYWAKIGNKYKGLGYNEYMQEFNKWFDQQNFNPLEKRNRNYIAKQNWDKYVKLGYNKPVNVLNDAVVIPEKGSKDNSLSNNIQAETPEYQNGMHYVYNNGKFELIPTETETPIKTETPIVEESKNGNTYESIVEANTNLAKNRIFNSGWRGAFKDSLNRALMTPDYYNNGEGTQVFDFELPDGTVVNYDYLSENRLLNRHGLLKAGAMRKLAKNFKQQGRNIALLRYIGIGNQQISPNAASVTNITDTYEPNYGIKMIGATTPILGPDWNRMENEVEKYQLEEPDITV